LLPKSLFITIIVKHIVIHILLIVAWLSPICGVAGAQTTLVQWTPHHLPGLICCFFGGKNIKFLFPAAMEENIARVNLLCKPSDSTILMAIDAIDAIFLDQVNP
jgi:hypothetical protein